MAYSRFVAALLCLLLLSMGALFADERLNRLKRLMDEAFIDYSEHITRFDPEGRQAQFLYQRYLNFKNDYEGLRDSGRAPADAVDFSRMFLEQSIGIPEAGSLQEYKGRAPGPDAHAMMGWYLFSEGMYREAEILLRLAFEEMMENGDYAPVLDWGIGWLEVRNASASIEFAVVESMQVSVLKRVLRILTGLRDGTVPDNIVDPYSSGGTYRVRGLVNSENMKEAAEMLLDDARALL